jgi:circadian clock protein KaiC
VEAICDNVLFLRFFEHGGRLHRLISVLKMRDSDNDPYLRELAISSRGVEVRESYDALDALITGQPRPRQVPETEGRAQRPRKTRAPPARKKGVSRPRGRKR